MSQTAKVAITTAAIIVISLVAIVIGMQLQAGNAASRYDQRGERIVEYGTESLDVLDKFGPVTPAEGNRSEQRLSDLHDDNNDPTRRWNYRGSARYETGASTQAAFDGLVDHLLANGWYDAHGNEAPETLVFARDDELGVWFITMTGPTADDFTSVAFTIRSEMAG